MAAPIRFLPAAEVDAALAARGDLVVVFHASWCTYSCAFLPLVEALSAGQPVPVAVVDVSDTGHPAWDRWALDAVPTALRLRDGAEVARAGAVPLFGLSPSALKALFERGS